MSAIAHDLLGLTLIVIFVISVNAHRNASHEERLLEYLFRDYDPVARAVMDTSQPVNVGIEFVLLRIHGLVSLKFQHKYRVQVLR